MSTDKQLSDSFIWELWQTSPDDGPVAFARAVIEADRKLAQGADIPVERQEAAAQAEPHIDGWPLYSGLPPPKAEPEQSATAPSVPTLDQKMRDAGYTARPMPSRDPDHLASAPTQASATSVQKPNEIEAAAKAVIELWRVPPRWNDRIKQSNALYRLAYAIEPDKWTPKLANGLTEAETSATRSVSGLTQPQAESEGGEP